MHQLHTIHFNSTKSCNLSCSFCYDNAVRGSTVNLELDIIRQLANDVAECGGKRVILSGGEPLSRIDWRKIALEFDRFNFEVSVATNGTLIREKTVEFLKELKKPTLSISLDGGEQVHNNIRGSNTAYKRTMRGLELLKDSEIPFHINSVLFKGNISEIATLTKVARDFNCPVRLTLLHDNGRANHVDEKALNAEQILMVREYCHTLRKLGINIFLNLPPLLQYVDEIIPSRGAACGWGESFCGVLANGDVTVCGVASDEPLLVAGNIKNERFSTIWNNSELFAKTRSFRTSDLRGVCNSCPFNEFCGGACRLSAFRNSGDFLASYSLCQYFKDAGYIPDELLVSEDWRAGALLETAPVRG